MKKDEQKEFAEQAGPPPEGTAGDGGDDVRRKFFKTAGAAAFTLGAFLAGCGDDGGGGKDPEPDAVDGGLADLADALPDLGGPDAAPDASPDVTADVTPDLTADLTPDLEPSDLHDVQPDLGHDVQPDLPEDVEPDIIEPPVKYDKVVNTACGICMIRCAMKAYLKDGKVVYIGGNPADPFNRGKLCPKGQASLGFLYNEDRLVYPLRRTSADKGYGVDPQWEQITWEEAYTEIITKITEATESAPGAADFANGEQFAIIAHSGYYWDTKLLTALGSPNMVTHYDTCFSTSFVGRKALTGSLPWTNIAGAKYILSFGWDQPERSKNQPTGQFSKAMSDGATCVCLNPYQGMVGAKAQQWIPIKPGTDLAVMLAMINHILANDLFDADYVTNRTNFTAHEDDIRAAFVDYTPEWAEGISGVPAATIVEMAEDFTAPANQPAILPIHKRDGAGGPNYANSFHAAHASIILNALVGAIDRDGGEACLAFGWKPKPHLTMMESPPEGLKDLIKSKGSIDGKHEFPLVRDLTTDRGIFANLPDRIMAEDPYPLKMAMFRRYGLHSFPEPAKMVEAIQKLDYVVFSDTLPKEIMWFADLVLPEPMFLESTYISNRKFCTPGKKLVMSANKVHGAPGECKGWTGVMMELGKRFDELRGTSYFKLDSGDYVTGGAEKNSIAADIEEGMTFDDVKALENGVWSKDVDYVAKSEYSTPSKKIEIFSERMEAEGYAPLPAWLPKAAEATDEYPLSLLLMRWAGFKHSAPLSNDNPYALDAFPASIALVHPDTAGELGITTGDAVWLESTTGKMKTTARVSERIRPDCVLTNHNYGHTITGLTYQSPDQGDGPLIPIRAEADALAAGDWSAAARMSDVCVKIYKA